jgi:hypothetical protein
MIFVAILSHSKPLHILIGERKTAGHKGYLILLGVEVGSARSTPTSA